MNDQTSLAVRKNGSALASWVNQDLDALAERLGLMIANGKKLNPDERLALAAYAQATDLNPFANECYFIPGVGPGPGIAGWRKKAEEQLEYEANKARVPSARFWCEYVTPEEGEANYDPKKNDIAVKAILHDTITKTEWERRVLGHYIELVKNDINDGAWEKAQELVGPEPVWTAVGVVYGSERFAYDNKPEKMDRYERACKRAEKAAIRKRFPRVSLPQPAGWENADIIDSVAVDVTQEPRSEGQIMSEIGYEPPAQTAGETATDQPASAQAETGEQVRPYSPAALRTKILDRAQHYAGKKASKAQIGLFVSMIEKTFAGPDASLARHAVQHWLFQAESANDIDPAIILACLNDWMRPEKDSGGDYQIDRVAAHELQLVYQAALADQGQLAMDLDTGVEPYNDDDIPEEFR